MRKFCLGIVGMAFAMTLFAQKISNKVICSVGGVMTSSTHQITYTIGETVIKTLSASGQILTQGFQQPVANSGLSLQNPSSSESLVAYIDHGVAKIVWGATPTAKTGNFVLQRLNNESKIYETIDTRPFNSSKTALSEYDFTDNDPQDGDNIYRIKQVVVQEVARFSDVRKLNFNAVDIVTLFPNPTIESVNLDLSSYMGKGADISIFSYSGQLMLQQQIEKISDQPIKILLNHIETGRYQIRIKVDDKKNFIVKPLMISK